MKFKEFEIIGIFIEYKFSYKLQICVEVKIGKTERNSFI